MQWNRQITAFHDRNRDRCVAASPLAGTMLGDSAIGLAAVEIARAIASGFSTDLQDHLISLDLLGSTVARHYVATRPQCPSCGREELRDAQRTPAPIRLRAGGKLVMTSGGYRAVAPAATVARSRKHVSPLTGVLASQRSRPICRSTPAICHAQLLAVQTVDFGRRLGTATARAARPSRLKPAR